MSNGFESSGVELGKPSRRRLIYGAAAVCALPVVAAFAQRDAAWVVDSRSGPFTLGVASGFPLADGFSLWTRLAPQPMQADGGMPAELVAVSCEIATDPAFAQIVQTLKLRADPANAHAVHGYASGLNADRWYWYRFIAGGATSPVGRARTAPAAYAAPASLRVILASCQHFEAGLFRAWQHAAQQEADAVLFVGDYMYESQYGRAARLREHDGGAPRDLAAYRKRYAWYKRDADLQAAHAAFPWMLMWDDHEVENDYAALASARLIDPVEFAAQRLAAYKAYWEHQPMPRQAAQFTGPNLALNTRLRWGQLADLWTLDTRQFRSVHACQAPVGAEGKGGGKLVNATSCPELIDPARSLLGLDQERWIASEMWSSTSTWRVLTQPTQVSATALPGTANTGDQVWTDAWDGYPAARERLLQAASANSKSVVTLGGDVHRHVAANLRGKPNDERSPILASEFVASSISSRGLNDLTRAAGNLRVHRQHASGAQWLGVSSAGSV
jgi:alkaline phosphatase D